jgi:hypothetical protein
MAGASEVAGAASPKDAREWSELFLPGIEIDAMFIFLSDRIAQTTQTPPT